MIQERNYLIHPSFIALTLLLAGVTALFLGFSASYLYTRFNADVEPIKLPFLFFVNTVILIISSYTLRAANTSYIKDETEKYKAFLIATLVITIIFLVSQCIAWYQLLSDDILINHSNMASYMYIISGVHFAHVILGIPFLALFIYQAIKYMKEPVSVLVYFADPQKKRRLKLLTIYWHFIDILWIYLVAFLFINYLIK